MCPVLQWQLLGNHKETSPKFTVCILVRYLQCGAWDSVVVKAQCYKSEDPGIDFRIFPVASDISMCPGVDSDSKNEYQDNPGVRVAGA